MVGAGAHDSPFVRCFSGRRGADPYGGGGSNLFTGLVRFPRPNHAVGVYIINSVGIAYHQCEALYIIKPQEDARYRVMIYKGGIAALDDIPPCGG